MMRTLSGLFVLGCLGAVPAVQAQTTVASTANVHTANAHTIAQRIAVAAQDLHRGTVLRADDIRWISTDSARTLMHGAPVQASDVQPGWVARRAIHTGDILQPPSVSRPDLVTTGETVDVVYADTGIKLTLKGTAIGDGRKGDEVYVRLTTRKRLRATVVDDHTVRIAQ